METMYVRVRGKFKRLSSIPINKAFKMLNKGYKVQLYVKKGNKYRKL